MPQRLVDRIPFAKIVTILAVIFGLSLGLCGVTLVLSLQGAQRTFPGGQFLDSAGTVELLAMLLSGAGLVITTIVWVVLLIAGGSGAKASTPQNLPGDELDPDDKKEP